jgi:hypothetical protein
MADLWLWRPVLTIPPSNPGRRAVVLLLSGIDASARGHDEDALDDFSRALSFLIPNESTNAAPLADFGMRRQSFGTVTHAALAASLLTRRAIVALRMGLGLRAVADTDAALALHAGSSRAAFWRALALLRVLGGCAAAIGVLTPFADTPHRLGIAIRILRIGAAQHAAHVLERVSCLTDASASAPAVPHEEKHLAFLHGSLRLVHLPENKGRGWVATEHIEAGALLLCEPSRFPVVQDSSEPLPLLRAVTTVLKRGGPAARTLKEYLSCMHPQGTGDDTGTSTRDMAAAPSIDAIGALAGLGASELRLLDHKLQRNQMALRTRASGTLVDLGASVFPLCALFNHSCFANARWRPLGTGGAVAIRALRAIAPSEEISISYVSLSTVGPARLTALRETFGFLCRCERCAAPRGSALYGREQAEMALVCEVCGDSGAARGGAGGGGGMVPDDPYAASPIYRCCCAVGGGGSGDAGRCGAVLTGTAAQEKLQIVLRSFRALKAFALRGDYVAGCAAARAAEEAARRVLMPLHHAWSEWTTIAMVLADGADEGDAALLLAAYSKHARRIVPERAEDEDVFILFNHAVVAGIDEPAAPEAEAALRRAFELDQASVDGARSIEGFVARWVPRDLLEFIADDVRRILRGPHGGPDPKGAAAASLC